MRRLLVFLLPLILIACQDSNAPVGPTDQADAMRSPTEEVAAWFRKASPEIMALPQTVFAAHDETAGQLVLGVENPGVTRGVENVLRRHGIPVSGYRIQVTEPIHLMNTTLRTEHRPTVGGLQIHWDNFVCTLGFNVTHASGRSFITNSHCTTIQGANSGTFYNQPSRTESSTPIADEVHDPAYSATLAGCSSGKRCRRSDASRALYRSGAESSQGVIAKTTGVNNGSLTVGGHFTITSQNNTATSFSGTFNKVGRTTGWSSGNVTSTCATVNVSGSDIQLLCQTLVQRRGRQIVGGGDSGSPVFRITSGDNVELVGILWGGSTNGDLFVFSPLSNIQGELGEVTAIFEENGGDPTPTPPTAPSNLGATATSSSQINLSWQDNSNDEDGFEIQRKTGSAPFATITTTAADATSHSDTQLTADTEYSYRVRAVKSGTEASAWSNEATARTLGSAVEPPSGLTLEANGYKVRGRWTTDLSWSGSSANQFVVRRDGATIATVSTTSYQDSTNFVGGGSLSYQVCEAGTSTCSNEVTVNF